MRKRMCSNCKYWDWNKARENSMQKSTMKRLCRRFPPTVITGRDDADYPNTGYYWWCGEFSEK